MNTQDYKKQEEQENGTSTGYPSGGTNSSPGKKPPKGKKGFYIALVICLTAVTVAGWTAYSSLHKYKKSTLDTLNTITESTVSSPQESLPSVSSQSGWETSSVTSEPAQSSQAEASAAPASSAAAAAQPKSAAPAAAAPAGLQEPVPDAPVQHAFSETPLYSKTMHDWRAHAGIDLRAAKGTPVCAAADGTVQAVSEPEDFGGMVQVVHANGLTTCYCGLTDISVHKGDTVKVGHQLGKVGEIPCEADEAPHLHFAVQKSGKFLDPADLLK